MSTDDSPQSVEEAGALLGAAITRCGVGTHAMTVPPKGMHSSFATITPVPASELFVRLSSLRSLLRSAPQDVPLIAAPSLLAVLMKLLGVSSSLASKSSTINTGTDASKRVTTPPMLSTPLRKLWVDCIVLCHQLGEGLTGNSRIDTYAFVRSMLALASLNPKSAKAAGGTRIAVLDVVGGLFVNSKLIQKLAPWALDVLLVCHKALKSSGNGEPTYRISATRTACCVAVACRQSSLISRPLEGKACFYLRGAVEDKAILEAIRLLKQATTDKFPEVRSTAANFAATIAPMIVMSTSGSGKSAGGADIGSASPTSSLEDVMSLSIKNLDDESPYVALAWAEALARCISTAVEYGEQSKANVETRRNAEDEGAGSSPDTGARQSSRKATGLAVNCSTLNSAISFLVEQFVKVGGELAASRSGGTFSVGGRAVRAGLTLALVKLIRLQSTIGSIGEDGMSIKEVIAAILTMVGPNFEKQLNATAKSSEGLDATSPGSISPEKATSSLFGQVKQSSQADAGLARLAASRVLRQGLSEGASEPTQLAILNELIRLCKDGPAPMNPHQLQVIVIEMSHLYTTLGESAASSLSDATEALKLCVVHVDHGVRHEAALTCASLAASFNVETRMLVRSSVDEFQLHHAELFALASTGELKKKAVAADPSSSRLRRFRKSTEPKAEDPSVAHQCAIHGYALMVSVLLKELPRVPGGLPTALLGTALSAAEILISCQYNEVMTQANPGAACTCVRAGYGIICGALTAGSEAVTPHIANMFGLWQKSYKSAGKGGAFFTLDHDLICLDAMISSVVVFLSHCSDLLLAVPDALSRTTLMLEEVLLLFLPGGRLGNTPTNPAAASRHESTKAFILEAFAWLPPGSFPMAADGVFSLAETLIQSLTEEEVTCSILSSLVNKEDGILDARSMSRARRVGQVGGARDLEETIIWLTSDTAHPGERESVLHFRTAANPSDPDNVRELRGSHVLGLIALDSDDALPPTPLHEVGTWRKPMEPFCSTKVRLVDASIQAFAATFGMKGGKDQQAAVDALETLVPPFLAQLARVIGVNSALSESERRTKSKEENAAVANITAVLLACLKSLPLHEASQGVPMGLGPPWMKKAKDLLLTLMPSTLNVVRRAATEGLSLLATLCVAEDAHFLQSTVLHSLDEVMQGNNPDGKPKTIPLEPVSAARAGSLLTLACIQRTSTDIQIKQNKRSRNRLSRGAEAGKQKMDELPTLQMMTRIIPSVVCYGYRDAFVVRTYAIHSLGLLLAYSGRIDHETPTDDDLQLIRKGVEIVEDNFLASWTAASLDSDRGMEGEKLEREASFLAVLLRLMTYLIPSLRHLESTDPSVATRFGCMAALILECFQAHPVVFMEGMAFYELMIARQQLSVTQHLPDRPIRENPISPVMPFVLSGITPELPQSFFALEGYGRNNGCLESPSAIWTVIHIVKQLSQSEVLSLDLCASKLCVSLYALLEVTCGRRCFPGGTVFRALAAPRETESFAVGVEGYIVDVLETLLIPSVPDNSNDHLLHWVLLSRAFLAGSQVAIELDESERNQRLRVPTWAANFRANSEAFETASQVFAFSTPLRWQVKSIAVKIATIAVDELAALNGSKAGLLKQSPSFNPSVARTALDQTEATRAGKNPKSFLVLHLGEVLTAACTSSVSTLDQSELRWLQANSIQLLAKLIELFGGIEDPEQPGTCILSQYSTQIVSAVKHALTAPDEDELGSSKRLFLTGCLALQAILRSGLAEDTQMLKRLVRLITPEREETPFFDYDSGFLDEEPQRKESMKLENTGYSTLPVISKLWALGFVRVTSDLHASIVEMPSNAKVGVAVHSAAVAMDGSRLLVQSGFTLCGLPNERVGDGEDSSSTCAVQGGILYGNINDIDESVKTTITSAWACCGANALCTLIEILSSKQETQERLSSCLTWLKKLVPLMFAGVFSSIPTSDSKDGQPRRISWVPLLDSSEVVADCIRGLTALVNGADEVAFEDSWQGDLEKVCTVLSREILLPALCRSRVSNDGANATATTPVKSHPPQRLIVESCRLIEMVAASETMGQRESPALMMAILWPLNALQSGNIQSTDPLADIVIASSLKCASSLMKVSSSSESLVTAMLHVATDILRVYGTDDVNEAARELLGCVVLRDTITLPMRQKIACDVLEVGNWAAWVALCLTSSDDRGISTSLSIVQKKLSEYDFPEQQMAALTAVRQVVQQRTPSPLATRILQGVAPELFGILYAYGTLKISPKNYSFRTVACADTVKVVLVAYQQLASEEELLPAFLTVLFASFINMIRFNGLPNHTSPQPGADAALGRMSAQSIMYVARTTPAAFKASLAALSEHDRAVLELAVRAEMSGYAPTTQSVPKKKLDLKAFKTSEQAQET